MNMTDSVTVSTLPHPMSMFMMGIVVVVMIYVIIEHLKLRREMKELHKSSNALKESMDSFKTSVFESINDVSRKVDSRVDKAVESLKKSKTVL